MKTSPDNTSQDLGLVESAFLLSTPVEGNRHNPINSGVSEEAFCPRSHDAPEMPPQGDLPTVFEEEEDIS